MIRDEESIVRVKLATRVLIRVRCRCGQSLLQSEVAQLRFLAECDDETSMPLEKLAIAIIERERRRMGIPPQAELGFSGRN
jgi:hypothetical protein